MPELTPEEKFAQLIYKISPAYCRTEPDCLVRALAGEDVGDGLAVFIVNECRDVHDADLSEGENLQEMSRVMGTACRQICDVANEMDVLRYSSKPLREQA
jgi:hypothetical protein